MSKHRQWQILIHVLLWMQKTEYLWRQKSVLNLCRPLGQEATIENPDRVNAVDTYVFSNFYSNFWQTLQRSFSALSKPNFASKYSFESSWRDLQDLHTFALGDSNLKTNNSASGKRPPDETHGPGEETTAPHSTIQLNFAKHFAILQMYSQFLAYVLQFWSKIHHIWWIRTKVRN